MGEQHTSTRPAAPLDTIPDAALERPRSLAPACSAATDQPCSFCSRLRMLRNVGDMPFHALHMTCKTRNAA